MPLNRVCAAGWQHAKSGTDLFSSKLNLSRLFVQFFCERPLLYLNQKDQTRLKDSTILGSIESDPFAREI